MELRTLESLSTKYKKSPEENDDCHDTTHKHSFALGITADDGHEYFFGTAQFLDAELAANPAIEQKADAPPERLHLRYATGEAVILGCRLRKFADLIQRGELKNVRPARKRYASLRQSEPMMAMISSITVTRKETA